MSLTWTPTLDRALAVAAHCHAGQTRKDDPTPYIAHPVAVALIVSDFTSDEDVAVAALLHDVLEDVPPTVYSADDMTAEFGERVTELVRGVSEEKTAGVQTPPWRVRKEGYLARLAEDSHECLLISAADKIHNLRSMVTAHERLGGDMWGLFNAGPEEKLWFYRAIADAVAERLGDCTASRELRRAVDDVAALAPVG
ncbi:bifunctional (p)ppGpp synthetase/guanosine-3',5'-bis(diphosphate) 3'-pyrophosphohydrolase [Dietzia sp. SLG510A3-3B2-2]|nr:bifunctional (p)ppGpp synthetase/guanosine-3',5'-bis(diphosphate) 3'-pyrophosphohydrolase [Dietzia sp. SLG510A3-40A3]MBB1009581.1 bifunctional (p)ppGpp synthetase/guanosine-3',5'-bis(diphosphate) 3'-pyrophosphohydrolase [Dietzia sp. SLG510A3-3B2-2]